MDRKQRGLCFKCGGSYGPLHQCPVKQLRVVMLNEEIQVECDDIEEENEDDDALEAGEIEGACTTLSLCSMATGGDAQSRTMKLQGKIGEIPLLFLVDSGATHNFISQKLVKALGRDKTYEDFDGRWAPICHSRGVSWPQGAV